MCVIFISFEANVRDKVRIVAIDCRGNNRSTVAYLENEIRVDQTIVGRERERKTQKRKLASILSISAIDHRRHCVWSFREERKKIITSAPFSLSLSLVVDKNAHSGYRNLRTYHCTSLLLSSSNVSQKDSMIDTFLLLIHLLRKNEIESEKEREESSTIDPSFLPRVCSWMYI